MGTRKVRNITTEKTTLDKVIHLFPGICAYGSQYITLGKNVSFNNYCHVTATKESPIIISDDVLIGPFVVINTGDHGFEKLDVKIRDQEYKRGTIFIGKDVWIGASSVILRGSIIPDKCVIGALSRVSRNSKLLPGHIYAGNPLKLLGFRK